MSKSKQQFIHFKKKTVSLARKTLLGLLKDAGDFYESGARTYRPFSYPKDYSRNRDAQLEFQRIKSLERQELIKIRKRGEKLFFELTEAGKSEALKAFIVNCDKRLTDDQVCVVVFDIPENIRSVRDALRKLLKDAGFYKVQRSIWETDKDIAYEMQKFIEMLKMDDYVQVYRSLPLRRRI